ncbi:hypothetical protein, partial [Aestuariivirga sp.]|uniref:hypothetical protein n=1 Tax=Aestuariivirga sp. TaxID=2650926 RepID=UPI00359400EB
TGIPPSAWRKMPTICASVNLLFFIRISSFRIPRKFYFQTPSKNGGITTQPAKSSPEHLNTLETDRSNGFVPAWSAIIRHRVLDNQLEPINITWFVCGLVHDHQDNSLTVSRSGCRIDSSKAQATKKDRTMPDQSSLLRADRNV